MSGKIPQTAEEVDAIPTLAKALTIIGNLVEVPPNTQLDEAKMIIKILFDLNPPPSKRGPLVEMKAFAAAVQVDNDNRKHLRELFRRVRDYLAKLPQPFQDNLNLMYPNYKEQMSYYTEELEAKTCTLLVAGETCSGKSSFINMLIGKDLLPIGDLRCTSAIVEIMYSKVHEVDVYPKNRTSGSVSPRKILLMPGDEGEKDLQSEIQRIITERDATTDESPFEKVVIRWPLECLECGVTIVDSPGVGDSATLPQTLAKYIAKAFGLIFVIDATSSIPKHRLAQLLLKASECREGFDPNTALFVCNRWEAVSQEDSDRVRDSFVQRLSFIVPGFKGTQLYPISVKNSIIQLKYGIVCTEYAALIEGIREMLPKTMAGKLRIYYRYVSALLERTNKSLKLSINIQMEKAEDTRKKYEEVKAKMAKINDQSDVLLKELKHRVHIFSENVAKDLVCHLDSHKIRAQMAADIDLKVVGQQRRSVKKAEMANTLIAEAVCDKVNEFERSTMLVKNMLDEIKMQFYRQFNLFQEQLSIVEDKLMEDEQLRIFVNVTRTSSTQSQDIKLRKGGKGTESCDSIGAFIVSRLDLDVKSVQKIFKEDFEPVRAMRQAIDIYLQNFTKNTISSCLNGFFQRLVDAIDRVGNHIPNILKLDEELLVKLRGEFDDYKKKSDALPSFTRDCMNLQGKLDLVFAARLMVTDFKENQLIVRDKVGRGQFATVYKAALCLDGAHHGVAVKIPLNPISPTDVAYTILEDAVLRELKHENIVRYYGVYRTEAEDNMKLVFVLEYCEETLMSEILKTNPPSSFNKSFKSEFSDTIRCNTVTDYILQLCSGLEYLHHKSIAHRDLKPENILILVREAKRTIKIADFGLAKKMLEPASSQVGTRAYMAPEILLGGAKYDTKVDIYSLALIVWSLWYGMDLVRFIESNVSRPFEEAVREKWRPSITMVHPPPDSWILIIEKCWDQDPKKRPTASEVANNFRSLSFLLDDE